MDKQTRLVITNRLLDELEEMIQDSSDNYILTDFPIITQKHIDEYPAQAPVYLISGGFYLNNDYVTDSEVIRLNNQHNETTAYFLYMMAVMTIAYWKALNQVRYTHVDTATLRHAVYARVNRIFGFDIEPVAFDKIINPDNTLFNASFNMFCTPKKRIAEMDMGTLSSEFSLQMRYKIWLLYRGTVETASLTTVDPDVVSLYDYVGSLFEK